MRSERAREEVAMCKRELSNFLRYLANKRAILESTAADLEGCTGFRLGCKIFIRSEIARLSAKIQETLSELQISNKDGFRHLENLEKLVDCSDSENSDSEGSSKPSSDEDSSDSFCGVTEEESSGSTDTSIDEEDF